MNMDAKILQKIRANQIQPQIKRTTYHDQETIQRCKADLTSENLYNTIGQLNKKQKSHEHLKNHLPKSNTPS